MCESIESDACRTSIDVVLKVDVVGGQSDNYNMNDTELRHLGRYPQKVVLGGKPT